VSGHQSITWRADGEPRERADLAERSAVHQGEHPLDRRHRTLVVLTIDALLTALRVGDRPMTFEARRQRFPT
jgi:hypothetical protein